MGGFLGLNIVYTYAASGEVTQLPIDVAWACTNLWSGFGILLGPFFSGLSRFVFVTLDVEIQASLGASSFFLSTTTTVEKFTQFCFVDVWSQ